MSISVGTMKLTCRFRVSSNSEAAQSPRGISQIAQMPYLLSAVAMSFLASLAFIRMHLTSRRTKYRVSSRPAGLSLVEVP